MSLEVELRYRDIQERYRTLDMYQIPVDQEQVTMVQEIEQRWKDLFTQAKMVDRSLIVVKKKFTIVSLKMEELHVEVVRGEKELGLCV